LITANIGGGGRGPIPNGDGTVFEISTDVLGEIQ
jgi:hypothetical protein